jgi:hypothetical protein
MATTATVSNYAIQIAGALQERIRQGGAYEDIYSSVYDLCTAVLALAECVNANATTLSTAVNPSQVAISNKYTAQGFSNTSPLQTTP